MSGDWGTHVVDKRETESPKDIHTVSTWEPDVAEENDDRPLDEKGNDSPNANSLSDSPSYKRPTKPMQPEPPQGTQVEPNQILGVFGIAQLTREDRLKEVYSAFGTVEDIQIIYDRSTRMSKCYGFVYMSTIEEAEKALKSTNGMTLDGRHIRVDYSTTQRPHSPTPGKYMGLKGATAVSDKRPDRYLSDRNHDNHDDDDGNNNSHFQRPLPLSHHNNGMKSHHSHYRPIRSPGRSRSPHSQRSTSSSYAHQRHHHHGHHHGHNYDQHPEPYRRSRSPPPPPPPYHRSYDQHYDRRHRSPVRRGYDEPSYSRTREYGSNGSGSLESSHPYPRSSPSSIRSQYVGPAYRSEPTSHYHRPSYAPMDHHHQTRSPLPSSHSGMHPSHSAPSSLPSLSHHRPSSTYSTGHSPDMGPPSHPHLERYDASQSFRKSGTGGSNFSKSADYYHARPRSRSPR